MAESPRDKGGDKGDKGKEKLEGSPSADSIVKEKSSLKVAGQPHTFYKRHYVGPVYCNLCKESIWGMGKACYACEVCSFVAHKKCSLKAPQNCVRAHSPSSSRRAAMKGGKSLPELRSDPNLIEVTPIDEGADLEEPPVDPAAHHWIEGNLPFGKRCKVCHTGFSFKGFEGVSCSRCKKACHIACTPKMDPCSPKHKQLLYDDDMLSEDFTQSKDGPLIAFINPKSGGQQGAAIFRKLKRLLSIAQVFDLTDGGPLPGLEKYIHVPNLRVLVCGGDGSVGWVLSVLDKMNCLYPALGVLPLGTGNDLARALEWGGGYSGERLSPILRQIEKAEVVEMDRWKLECIPLDPENKTATFIMNNYFSIGADAVVALKFHNKREAKPHYFQSRLLNKGWYGRFGMENMISPPGAIESYVELEIDGQRVPLSKSIDGLIIQNVPSYAAGCDMWGKEKKNFGPQSMDDGLLEVIGITGTLHMGMIQVGMGHGRRLGQASSIKIINRQPIAAQVDGEPWMLQPCTNVITHFNKVLMLRKPKTKGASDSDASNRLNATRKQQARRSVDPSFSTEAGLIEVIPVPNGNDNKESNTTTAKEEQPETKSAESSAEDHSQKEEEMPQKKKRSKKMKREKKDRTGKEEETKEAEKAQQEEQSSDASSEPSDSSQQN